MPLKHIDSLQDIDLETVPAQALAQKVVSGQPRAMGTGHDKKKVYRHGAVTELGDIELSIWIRAAEYVVHREGWDEELQHMTACFEAANLATSIQSSHSMALDAVLSGLFRDPKWVFFIEYNRQYHPELLETAHIVTLVTDCCGYPVKFTAEQAARTIVRTHCPACGEWSPCSLQDGANNANQEV